MQKRTCEDCGETYVSYISGSKDYGYRHLNCPASAAKAAAARVETPSYPGSEDAREGDDWGGSAL